MGVASGCGEQEAGVASGSGWNLGMWLLGVVVRQYNYCERSELSGLFNGTDFSLHNYISGRTSCRKCSKCFYVYLNIRPIRYSAMQL